MYAGGRTVRIPRGKQTETNKGQTLALPNEPASTHEKLARARGWETGWRGTRFLRVAPTGTTCSKGGCPAKRGGDALGIQYSAWHSLVPVIREAKTRIQYLEQG